VGVNAVLRICNYNFISHSRIWIMILQASNQLTLQEFLNLPPGDGDITYELVDGQAIPKMSPKKFHSKLTRAFIHLIEELCAGKGEVCPELTLALTHRGKDWGPTPDLIYISNERLPADWDEEGACSVPPDLVIEIISPGQTFGQMAAKAKNYLDAQVLRVWVVDSKARSITVFYPDAAPQTYMGDEIITDSLFEGWEFTVEQVFQKAKIPL
jgi:Uma2 family endonuclease